MCGLSLVYCQSLGIFTSTKLHKLRLMRLLHQAETFQLDGWAKAFSRMIPDATPLNASVSWHGSEDFHRLAAATSKGRPGHVLHAEGIWRRFLDQRQTPEADETSGYRCLTEIICHETSPNPGHSKMQYMAGQARFKVTSSFNLFLKPIVGNWQKLNACYLTRH